jgi:hypothetical protein
MFLIVPFLAWTGGIAAGAQVARGLVRGGLQLTQNREVLAGFAAPVVSAYEQIGRLGSEVACALIVYKATKAIS